MRKKEILKEIRELLRKLVTITVIAIPKSRRDKEMDTINEILLSF